MSFDSMFSTFFGVVTLAACFAVILHLKQVRWRWFSSRFGYRDPPPEIASKPGAAIVISAKPHREPFAADYTTYLATTLALHREGLSVRVRGPNYYANKPFLLPFEGLTVQPSRWPDLLYETVAVSHGALPDAYLIMARSDLEWAIGQGAPISIGAPSSSS